MHAMDFYVATCRCVMQADPSVPDSWADLHRLLPCLRQSLSCYVCFRILSDPMGPDHNVCKHSVCKACVGGKMRLKPSCSWCKDHWEFVPNSLLKVLISCFKKLCVYIYSSPIGQSIASTSVNGETNTLINLLKEVVEFDDNYLPHYATSAQGFNVHDESEQTSDLTQPESFLSVNTNSDIKAGSSSDEDKTNSCHTINESDQKAEKTIENFENIESDLDLEPTRRIHLSRSSSRVNNSTENSIIKQAVSKTISRKKGLKRVMFLKKKPHIKRTAFVRKPTKRHQTRKQPDTTQIFHSVTRQSSREAPQDLEKMDTSLPLGKRIKKELQPPRLKPPSFCKCGKSGNFNQLTCLGQRCPCYSMKLPCIGCKCKGCRNPKKGPHVQSNSMNYMSDLWASCSRTSSAVS